MDARHDARDDDNSLMTTAEAADYLGLHPGTLANDRNKRSLGIPFVRLGPRAIRYRRGDLRAFINARIDGGIPAHG